MGRLGQHLQDLGFGVLTLFAVDPHADTLPGEGLVHENHEPLHPGHGLTAKRQFFYHQIQFRSLSKYIHICHRFLIALDPKKCR